MRECASQLLDACPSLAIVATSRVALRTPFEWVFPVPGLSLRDDGADAAMQPVQPITLVALTAMTATMPSRCSSSARAAGVAAPALDRRRVAVLCASLDGVALAIELAAARCPALGLDGLIAGLDRGLRMLTTGGADAEAGAGGESHRSLRDAIAWSYRLLSASDRDVLDAISVFATAFDVDAALAVANPGADRFDVADALARLADHSLLLVTPGEPTRCRALETIRQFGAERLVEDARSAAVHERHRQWCREALEALAAQPHDDAWCERVDRVAADVRAALAFAADDERRCTRRVDGIPLQRLPVDGVGGAPGRRPPARGGPVRRPARRVGLLPRLPAPGDRAPGQGGRAVR